MRAVGCVPALKTPSFLLFPDFTEAWRQASEQEVKNLKVCIELTGLRLNKPRQLQHLQELWERHDKPDLCPREGLKVAPCDDRKSKTNGDMEKGARRRAEEERGWSRDALGYADVDAGKRPGPGVKICLFFLPRSLACSLVPYTGC